MCSRGLFWMKEGRQAVYRKWCERKHRCIIYQKDKSNHLQTLRQYCYYSGAEKDL